MNVILSETQIKKLTPKIQNLIDDQLKQLRDESEEWGLGEMDEVNEIQSVDKIVINRIVPIVKFKVYVDVYLDEKRYDFDYLLSEIQYRLSNWVPNIEIYLNEIIDNRKFGPGIDW